MNALVVTCSILLYLVLVKAELNVNSRRNPSVALLPSSGAPVDEVVVESSLHIKPKQKPNVRRIRSLPELLSLVMSNRVKRSPERRNRYGSNANEYGQSQSTANAAANSHFNDQFGFGASAANAQAQGFSAKGPSGSFGASSAGTQTQSLTSDKNGGTQNAAGASLAQTYTLPNGQTINFANTNNFANAPGANSASRGSAVQIN